MEDVERIFHPSVPANYVSLLDLRERWMNRQQQKMQLEEIEQKELQDDGELQVDREQVKSEKTSHPSVPANYVSILDLRERWMKQQQQKKQVEEIERNLEEKSETEVDQEQVNPEVEDKNDGDGKLRDERHSDDKPVVRVSNPDPNTANRRLSYRKPRGGKEGHKRWVPLKQAPVATMIRLTQALSIQSSEPDPTPAPAPADPVKPKVLPPLEIPKVETVVQVPASVTQWKAKVKNRKTNRKVDLLQSQPKKGVTVANSNLTEEADEKVSEEPTALLALHAHLLKPPPSDAVKVDTAIQVTGEIEGSGEEDKDRNGKMKRANVRNRKRHQNHNLVKPQPISDVLPPKSDLNEKYDARVQLEPKALPDLQSEQLKPSPLEANKVDLTVHPQIQSSDEVIADRKLDMIMKKKKKKSFKKNQKRYQKVESVTQPHMKKESLAQNAVDEKESIEQEVGADNSIVNDNGRTETEVVTEIKLDTVMKKKKPMKKNWKRNQKVESVTQPHLKKENLAPNVVEEKEILEQEVGADHNAEGDDWRAETDEEVASLAVTRAPEPEKSCSHRSVVAGIWKGQRQGGRYENFKRPIMMKKDRAWGEGSLVWVKKGESSQTETGDVTVKNAGNMRV